MKRSLLVTGVVALTVLAGCGSDTGSATGSASATAAPTTTASAAAGTSPSVAATPAPALPPAAAAAGVPELTGTPTDITVQSQAKAGTGAPPTELVRQDVVVGSGPAAALTDTVVVQYTGTLYSDGTLFDSSWSRGMPATFPLNRVVPGFAQGIEGMAVGGRRVIVIPPALGYGDTDRDPIPGGSTLVFVVDLVAIQ